MAQLQKRGMVGIQIGSTAFENLARTQARVCGVPDLPLVIVPHPLAGIGLDQVRARADLAIPKLVETLRKHVQ